eukprot:Em0008g738a
MQIVQGIVLFVAIASASATSARLAPLLAEDSPSAIDGEYLVVFHDSVSAEEAQAAMVLIVYVLDSGNSLQSSGFSRKN